MDDVIELNASSPMMPSNRERSRSPPRNARNSIIIINIPYDISWKDLKDVIRSKVKENIKFFVSMYMIDERPIGVAIIEAHNLNDSELILGKMDGFSMNGRTLVARYERPNDHDRYLDKGAVLEGFVKNRSMNSGDISHSSRPQHQINPRRSYTGNFDDSRNVMQSNEINNYPEERITELSEEIKSQGITYELINRLEITPAEISCKIYVGNLSYDVGETKLKEVFSLAGKIIDIKMRLDGEGKSRGFGTVTYELELHAVQAISMFNGQILNNRQMRVRMDRILDNKSSISVKLPDGLSSIGDGLGIMGKAVKNAASVKPEVLKINYDQHGNSYTNGTSMPREIEKVYQNHEITNRSLDSIIRNLENSDRTLRTRNSDQFGRVLDALARNVELPKVQYEEYNEAVSHSMPSRNYHDKPSSRLSPYDTSMRYNTGERERRVYSDRYSDRPPMEERIDRSRIIDRTPMRREKDLMPNIKDRVQINRFQKKIHHCQQDNISDAHKFQTGDDSIIVTNLPLTINWLDLRSKFREVGAVRYAEISKGNAKRGVVRFSVTEDAEKAVSQLNNTLYEGETISVFLERDAN